MPVITEITVVGIMCWGVALSLAILSGSLESRTTPKMLERIWWGMAKKAAQRRLDELVSIEWLNDEVAYRKTLHELTRYEAATRASLTKYVLLALPTFPTALAVFAFVNTRNPVGVFTPIVAMVALFAVISVFGAVTTALSNQSRRRPTGCFVVNAAVRAIKEFNDFVEWERKVVSDDTGEEISGKSYQIPVMSVVHSLDAVAGNLILFGKKRVRPDGRYPATELVRCTERAALDIRTMQDKVLLFGVDSRWEFYEKMDGFIGKFLQGRYAELSDNNSQAEDVVAVGSNNYPVGRNLLIAGLVGTALALFLDWIGMPEQVLVVLITTFAGHVLWMLGVQNRSQTDGSDSGSANELTTSTQG